MTWTPWVLPGLVSSACAVGAAIVVLRAAPDRMLNRRLFAVLFVEGTWAASGVFFTIESPAAFMTVASVGVAAMAALPFQYLSFLGVALETELIKPFRSRAAFWILAALSVIAAGALLLFPRVFLGELYSPPWATWNFRFTEWGTRLSLLNGASSLFGLAASLAAYYRARRGTAARERARWFAMAFGIRDLVYAILYLLYAQLRPIPFWGDFLYNQFGGIATVIFVALLTYGVLRHQLFDLDLKLKFVLRQSTVGAIIAGAFFLGSELLERFIPVEGTVLGLASAGVIVLLLRPVQRFSEAFASRLMPGVTDTPEYVDRQKHAVYRAALEGAGVDGTITERERSMLDRLVEQLGLTSDVAAVLEREVVTTG
ncbi:MAG: hypothetical protein ACC682_14350 [Gemmatimonadota bacterium]